MLTRTLLADALQGDTGQFSTVHDRSRPELVAGLCLRFSGAQGTAAELLRTAAQRPSGGTVLQNPGIQTGGSAADRHPGRAETIPAPLPLLAVAALVRTRLAAPGNVA